MTELNWTDIWTNSEHTKGEIISQTFLTLHYAKLAKMYSNLFSLVQSLSHVWLFATPWTAARQDSLSITNSQNLLKTHVHWAGDAVQTSHPLSSPSLPALNLSQHQGLFKWVSSSHQVAKVLEFQLQHQSFHEYSRLISFRMDWLYLLAVQGTLKSLLQNHSSKASILWRSAFFIVPTLKSIHDHWKSHSLD